MNRNLITFSLYTLISGVILFFSFQVIFEYPSHYLFGKGGDGLKNYYTITHYVKHDGGMHFSGMNYPYGEHIIFTDNQPVYAIFLNWISNNIIDLDSHIVGILNMWMIFSIFLTGWFVLLILRKFKLPDWYAIIFSLLITFLSPQLNRLDAHYALAYGFYIPAIWYYLLRIYDNKPSISPYIGLSITFLIASFTHLYFLPISMLLIVVFSLFMYLLSKVKPIQKSLLTIFLSLVFSGFIMLVISLTDTVNDRPLKPYGLDVYTASFESIFLPNIGWLHDLLSVGNQQDEGLAYIGIIGSLFTLIFGIYIIVKLYKHRKNLFAKIFMDKNDNSILLYASLLTGIFALFFSTYLFHKMDFIGILDHLGPLNQFRSIGRFAWIFYFIYTVFIAYYIHRFFEYQMNKKRFLLSFLILIFTIIIWNEEAQQHFIDATKNIFNQNRILSSKDRVYSNILSNAGMEVKDFQAIMQLPYVVVGPEHWGIARGGWSFRQSIRCSNDTGLPIIPFMMSRTSLIKSLDILQFLGSLPIETSRLKEMDERPLLLLCDTINIRHNEKQLLKKAKEFGQLGGVKLCKLSIDSLRSKGELLSKHYSYLDGIEDSIFLDGSKGYYWEDNFESLETDNYFNGKGSKLVEDEIIFCKDIPVDSQFYEVSIWVLLDPKADNQAKIFNNYSNSKGSNTNRLEIEQITDTKGYWVRYNVVVDSGMTHCMRIEGSAHVDAAMIRPLDSHLIKKEKGVVYYDNCPLPKIK